MRRGFAAVQAVLSLILLCACAPAAGKSTGDSGPDAQITVTLSITSDLVTFETVGPVSVALPTGHTVFDALTAVCDRRDIPVDYSGVAARGNIYIHAIDGVYEKSAGAASGWVFTVNGEKVTVSAGSRILADGDKIEWNFTNGY